jgi:hypothetical protein
MTNPQKAKGSAFERLICDYLAHAIPCERIPAGATLDRGDLWTPSAAIQCKNHRTISLGSWIDQTIAQQSNACKPLHALAIKRKGTTDPGSQLVVMTLAQFRSILTKLQ